MELKVGDKAKITHGYIVITAISKYRLVADVKYYFDDGDTDLRYFDMETIVDYYKKYIIKPKWTIKYEAVC